MMDGEVKRPFGGHDVNWSYSVMHVRHQMFRVIEASFNSSLKQ